MNNIQSVQALEGGMLTELGLDWGKTVVTAAALLAALLSSAPLPAQAVGADSGLDSRLSRSADGISAAHGVLPALLENRLRMSLHGVEDPALLFYLQRGFRPAWTQQEKLHGLIEAVRTLDEHGLDAADFALERLRTEEIMTWALAACSSSSRGGVWPGRIPSSS